MFFTCPKTGDIFKAAVFLNQTEISKIGDKKIVATYCKEGSPLFDV